VVALTDLPADVRDRAVAAAETVISEFVAYGNFRDAPWRDYSWARGVAVVDAVAGVLASRDVLQAGHYCDRDDLERELNKAKARVEELTAILESKDASLRTLVAQLDQATARVEQLTVALTGDMDAAWTHARAALAAAPTLENQPHICQPPDVGTIRENSSYSDRRWDCPMCGVWWLAMARPVDRPPVWKWCRMRNRQLPDIERAEP